jgi:hypothetical protein
MCVYQGYALIVSKSDNDHSNRVMLLVSVYIFSFCCLFILTSLKSNATPYCPDKHSDNSRLTDVSNAGDITKLKTYIGYYCDVSVPRTLTV